MIPGADPGILKGGGGRVLEKEEEGEVNPFTLKSLRNHTDGVFGFVAAIFLIVFFIVAYPTMFL